MADSIGLDSRDCLGNGGLANTLRLSREFIDRTASGRSSPESIPDLVDSSQNSMEPADSRRRSPNPSDVSRQMRLDMKGKSVLGRRSRPPPVPDEMSPAIDVESFHDTELRPRKQPKLEHPAPSLSHRSAELIDVEIPRPIELDSPLGAAGRASEGPVVVVAETPEPSRTGGRRGEDNSPGRIVLETPEASSPLSGAASSSVSSTPQYSSSVREGRSGVGVSRLFHPDGARIREPRVHSRYHAPRRLHDALGLSLPSFAHSPSTTSISQLSSASSPEFTASSGAWRRPRNAAPTVVPAEESARAAGPQPRPVPRPWLNRFAASSDEDAGPAAEDIDEDEILVRHMIEEEAASMSAERAAGAGSSNPSRSDEELARQLQAQYAREAEVASRMRVQLAARHRRFNFLGSGSPGPFPMAMGLVGPADPDALAEDDEDLQDDYPHWAALPSSIGRPSDIVLPTGIERYSHRERAGSRSGRSRSAGLGMRIIETLGRLRGSIGAHDSWEHRAWDSAPARSMFSLAFMDRDFSADDYEMLLRLDDHVPTKGASAAAIEALAEYAIPADAEAGTCCICLSGMCEGEMARRLSCVHTFHSPCIDKWLKVNRTCPICKNEVS